MDNYFLYWPDSKEIVDFSSYVREFGRQKYSNIRPLSLKMHYNDGIEICYVTRGTYKWEVEGKFFQLFPGDAFVTCPWQWHGSPQEVVDRGILTWLIIRPEYFEREGILNTGKWSSLNVDTKREVGILLSENKNPVLLKGSSIDIFFRILAKEFQERKLGYVERVNHTLDSLLVEVARSVFERKSVSLKDKSFIDQFVTIVTTDFTQKYSVKQLANLFGMCTTSLNSKTRQLTGFSPSDYIIELRINAAKEMLISGRQSITQIAIDCGFYSSQHFSSIFKQRTGKSPSEIRVKK